MSGQFTRVENMPFGDMAVDDISFTPKCRFVDEPPQTTTPRSSPTPCPDGKYTCNDGSCIEQVKIRT